MYRHYFFILEEIETKPNISFFLSYKLHKTVRSPLLCQNNISLLSFLNMKKNLTKTDS